jgi:hypothetical protein
MSGPKDLDEVQRRLVRAYEAIPGLWIQARDLHDQAFLRFVGDFEHVAGGADHPGVETTGDLRARTLWTWLRAAAVDLDKLAPLEVRIKNYFMAGRGADPDHRGPLQSHGEFEKRLRNQRKQAAAGEHIPARLVDQPPYPRMGR